MVAGWLCGEAIRQREGPKGRARAWVLSGEWSVKLQKEARAG